MEHRHLWLRSARQHAILRIRHTIVKAIRDYFDDHGFTLLDAPILTPAACEGTSTLFEVPYFDLGNAYLTQSGQLYGEAGAMAFGKIYVFCPTFRAEKSKTRKHLTEFWMVEPEVAYMDLEGDMDLAEDCLVSVVSRVLARHERELVGALERDVATLKRVAEPPSAHHLHRGHRTQAKGAGHPISWGDDIGGDEETVLANQFDRPVMVHRFPATMKAFYFKNGSGSTQTWRWESMSWRRRGTGRSSAADSARTTSSFSRPPSARRDCRPRPSTEEHLDLRRWGACRARPASRLGVEQTVAWLCGLHCVSRDRSPSRACSSGCNLRSPAGAG